MERPIPSHEETARSEDAAEQSPDGLIETGQPDAQQPENSRRTAIRALGKIGLGAAFGGLTMMATPRKARGQSMELTDILNFALALEYLEATYYQMGLDTSGLIPDGDANDVYTLIAQHEDEHVSLLQTAISAAGGEPLSADAVTFDFTGGSGSGEGPFDPFNDYSTFLLLSQGFEDTGVRAYKGQAAAIPPDASVAGFNVLTTALQVHSVEARHAAEVRRLRNANGMFDDLEPWVDEDAETDGTPVAPVYDGEGNTTQGGFDLTTALPDEDNEYSDEQIAEAFDEPLTMDEVIAIANLFTDQDLTTVFG